MKKDNRLKSSFIVKTIFVIIGMMFGFFIGIISARGIKIPFEFIAPPAYLTIMILVITYIVVIGIHELGHFISFVRNGIKMRALFITIFLIIYENHKWRLKIRPNNITAFGGIAIPEVMPVKDEEQFKRLQQAYARAILAGPITSIIAWLVLSLAIVPMIILGQNIYINSILIIFMLSITGTTLLIIIASLLKNEIAVGDFPAYSLAKNDRFFLAMQLYQYVLFSSNPETNRRKNTFLKGIICEGLVEKLKKEDTHIFTVNIIDAFLVEYLAGFSELPKVVSDYIDFFLKNPELIRQSKASEAVQLLRFHIIGWLYRDENTRDRAMGLYDEIMAEMGRKTPVQKYLIKQIEHIMGIADNSKYLENINNIRTSSAHGLWKNFEGYYIDEMSLNQQ